MRLLTIRQVCEICKINRNTLALYIREGRVKAMDLNPHGKRPTWRILAESLEGLRFRPEAELTREENLRRAGLTNP